MPFKKHLAASDAYLPAKKWSLQTFIVVDENKEEKVLMSIVPIRNDHSG